MTLPGPTISTGTRRPVAAFPTTKSIFLTGEAEKGKAGTPYLLRSMADFERHHGDRLTANALLHDNCEAVFALASARGVSVQVYTSREVSSSAARAQVILDDGSAVDTVKVRAKGEGTYGNKLNAAIEAGDTGGSVVLVITHDDDGELERSVECADVNELVMWGQTSAEHVDVEDVGTSSLDPAVVAATSLSGGVGETGATQTEVDTAWAAFGANLGPGYACTGGRTTDAAHETVIEHSAARNRVPRLTPANTDDESTLSAKAVTDKAVTGHDTGYIAWPWLQIKGLTNTTRRVIPPDVVAAALEVCNDAAGITPNQAAMSSFGIVDADLFIGLEYDEPSDALLTMFSEKGIVPFRVLKDGTVRLYDLITLANQLTNTEMVQSGVGRLLMTLRAELEPAAEEYVGREITAENLADLADDITAELQRFPTSIYGYSVAAHSLDECRTAQEFRVDALIQVTPGGRTVRITITKEGSA